MEKSGTDTVTYINPLYADVIDSENSEIPSDDTEQSDVFLFSEDDDSYLASISEAAAELCENMVNRETSVSVKYAGEGSYSDTMWESVFDEAMKHTGNAVEGDYLNFQWQSVDVFTRYHENDGTCYYTFTYTITYATTKEQEDELDEKLSSVMTELDLDSKSDYEKIRAVYDYICANVTYDYDHTDDTDYWLQYSAYAALINGTAVCQGYSVLFYRMMLEAGVDVRVIKGTSRNEAHAWNIVRADGCYYNCDTTWDADSNNYAYFLRCDDNFDTHVRADEYSTEEFYEEYPMSDTDHWIDGTFGADGDNLMWLLDNGILTISGEGEMED